MPPRYSGAPPPGAARFNPHPARRPDATPTRRHRGAGPAVSILIRPEDRMPRRRRYSGRGALGGFNPHPARRPDATRPHLIIYSLPVSQVSILIRPEDRMPRLQRRRQALDRPVWKVDEMIHFMLDLQGPLRGQRPMDGRSQVSILIRPEDRMPRPLQTSRASSRASVSILIRPEDRMPPAAGRIQVPILVPFQSSSGPKTGCHDLVIQVLAGLDVSILIRPEDRMPRRSSALFFCW